MEAASSLEQTFKDSRVPPELLTRENVLQYFSQVDANPFYERGCNNERVKMQNCDRLDPQKLL